jgi:hypothetical protein
MVIYTRFYRPEVSEATSAGLPCFEALRRHAPGHALRVQGENERAEGENGGAEGENECCMRMFKRCIAAWLFSGVVADLLKQNGGETRVRQ